MFITQGIHAIQPETYNTTHCTTSQYVRMWICFACVVVSTNIAAIYCEKGGRRKRQLPLMFMSTVLILLLIHPKPVLCHLSERYIILYEAGVRSLVALFLLFMLILLHVIKRKCADWRPRLIPIYWSELDYWLVENDHVVRSRSDQVDDKETKIADISAALKRGQAGDDQINRTNQILMNDDRWKVHPVLSMNRKRFKTKQNQPRNRKYEKSSVHFWANLQGRLNLQAQRQCFQNLITLIASSLKK